MPEILGGLPGGPSGGGSPGTYNVENDAAYQARRDAVINRDPERRTPSAERKLRDQLKARLDEFERRLNRISQETAKGDAVNARLAEEAVQRIRRRIETVRENLSGTGGGGPDRVLQNDSYNEIANEINAEISTQEKIFGVNLFETALADRLDALQKRADQLRIQPISQELKQRLGHLNIAIYEARGNLSPTDEATGQAPLVSGDRVIVRPGTTIDDVPALQRLTAELDSIAREAAASTPETNILPPPPPMPPAEPAPTPRESSLDQATRREFLRDRLLDALRNRTNRVIAAKVQTDDPTQLTELNAIDGLIADFQRELTDKPGSRGVRPSTRYTVDNHPRMVAINNRLRAVEEALHPSATNPESLENSGTATPEAAETVVLPEPPPMPPATETEEAPTHTLTPEQETRQQEFLQLLEQFNRRAQNLLNQATGQAIIDRIGRTQDLISDFRDDISDTTGTRITGDLQPDQHPRIVRIRQELKEIEDAITAEKIANLYPTPAEPAEPLDPRFDIDSLISPETSPEASNYTPEQIAEDQRTIDQLIADYTTFLATPEAATLSPVARAEAERITQQLGLLRERLNTPEASRLNRDRVLEVLSGARERLERAIEALRTPEATTSPEVPPTDPEAQAALSTAATAEGTQETDRALGDRVEAARLNLEPTEPTAQEIADVDEQIAAWIKTLWKAEQWDTKGSWSDAEIIADFLKNNTEFDKDKLFRKAIVQNRVKSLRKNSATYHDERVKEREAKAEREGKTWRKALKLLGRTGAGAVGGTVVRHLTQQGLIMAGAQGAHLISGLGGMVAGAVVGGVSGFFRGRAKAENLTYEGSKILAEIDEKRNNGTMTREQALTFYERLLKENKVRGEEEECLRLIDKIAQAKAEAELEDAIANIEPLPNETQDQCTARVLRELKRLQAADGGSAKEREKMVQEFLDEKHKYVGKEAWKAAGWSALKWGAFGGVFGALFPAPGLDSQLHARDLADNVKTPLHIHSNAEADEVLRNIQNIHEAHPKTAEAAPLIDQYLRSQHYNVKDLERLILGGEPYHELAKKVANQLGLDLNANVEGYHGNLYDLVNDVAGRLKDSGATNENTTRALFHVLSHPQETAQNIGQLQGVIAQAGKLGGHDFSAQFIHGGTPWWQPFTGGFMQGGRASDAFSGSARDFLMNHKDAPVNAAADLRLFWPTNTETPWFPFAAWFLSSTEAKDISEKGSLVERIKGAGDKLKERLGNKEKGEKVPPFPETNYLKFDKDIRKMMEGDHEKLHHDPRYEVMHKDMERFNKIMPTMHGQFIFLPGKNPGDKVRAFRVWPLNTEEARPNRKVPSENAPDKQNLAGRTYRSSGNEAGRLNGGDIQVIEFNLDEIYNKDSEVPMAQGPHGKVLEDTGDIPSVWSSAEKAGDGGENTRQIMSFEELFSMVDGNGRGQLLISPLEADIYAMLIAAGKLKPGEKLDDPKGAFEAHQKEAKDNKKIAKWLRDNREVLLKRLNGQETEKGDTILEAQRENYLNKLRALQTEDSSLSNEQAIDKMLAQLEGTTVPEAAHAATTAPETAPTSPPVEGETVAATAEKKAAVADRYRDNILAHLNASATTPLDTIADPVDRAIRDELVSRTRKLLVAKPSLSAEAAFGTIVTELPQDKERFETATLTVSKSPVETKILMETEQNKAKTEKIEDKEIPGILEKLSVVGTEFQGEKLTKEVVLELIRKYDLAPAHTVTAENKTMMFSKNRFYFEGRLAGLAYVRLNDDSVRPLVYLSSGSQADYRFYPGFEVKRSSSSVTSEDTGWFCKGYDEQSVSVPVAIHQALGHLGLKMNNMIPEKDRTRIVLGASKAYKNGEAFGEQPKLDTEVEPMPQTLTGIERLRLNQFNGSPENLKLRAEDSPDFTKPLARWEETMPVYGRVTKEVFESPDGQLRYLFARDRFRDEPRGWIVKVESTQGEINDRGLKRQWVDAGLLTVPAFEYASQATDGNGKYYGDRRPDDAPEYVDMYENFLSKIPVIKEYMATEPAAVVEPAAPIPPGPTTGGEPAPGSGGPDETVRAETDAPAAEPAVEGSVDSTETTTNTEQPPSGEVIKGIFERATKAYEGKYPAALFGINFDLEPNEIEEVEKLLKATEDRVNTKKTELPLYAKLQEELEKDREKLGTFGESGRIVADNTVTDIVRARSDKNVPILRVPFAIKELYMLELMSREVTDSLKRYTNGSAKGTAASHFGRDVQELYRFVLDNTTEVPKEAAAEEPVEADNSSEDTRKAEAAIEAEQPVEVTAELPELTERQKALYTRIKFSKYIPHKERRGVGRIFGKADGSVGANVEVSAFQYDPALPNEWKISITIEGKSDKAIPETIKNTDLETRNEEVRRLMTIRLEERLPKNREIKPNEAGQKPTAAETETDRQQEAQIDRGEGITTDPDRLFPELNVDQVKESTNGAGQLQVEIPLISRDSRFRDAVLIATQLTDNAGENNRWAIGLNGVIVPEGAGLGNIGVVTAENRDSLLANTDQMADLLNKFATDLDRRDRDDEPSTRRAEARVDARVEDGSTETSESGEDTIELKETVQRAENIVAETRAYTTKLRTINEQVAAIPELTHRHALVAETITKLDQHVASVEGAIKQTNDSYKAGKPKIDQLTREAQRLRTSTSSDTATAQLNELAFDKKVREINEEADIIDRSVAGLNKTVTTLLQTTTEATAIVETVLGTVDNEAIRSIIDQILDMEDQQQEQAAETREELTEKEDQLVKLLTTQVKERKLDDADKTADELRAVRLQLLALETVGNRQ